MRKFTAFTLLAICGLIAGCGAVREPGYMRTFPVEMVVDFGPAERPRHEERLLVEPETTAKEAVSQVFPVLSGKACCSLREVIEIGGVRVDPAKNRWWVCEINGSRNISPQGTHLQKGDRVEWLYVQS